MSVEPIGDFRAKLGEGPIWDERIARLWWVDPMGAKLLRTDPVTGTTEQWRMKPVCSVPCLTEGSDLLLGVSDGFMRFDPATAATTRIATLPQGPHKLRLNDGECDVAGRYWAGSMADDLVSGGASVYRLDRDGTLETIFGDVGLSNGIGFSPDDRILYYTDSLSWRIDQFDFDAAKGVVANRRTLVEVAQEAGLLDGITVDVEGFVWAALFGGSVVHRYAPDGSLDRILEIPAPGVTSVGFGGPDLDDLFITTSSVKTEVEGLPSVVEQTPLAGALFRHRPGVRGRHPHRFAG